MKGWGEMLRWTSGRIEGVDLGCGLRRVGVRVGVEM